MQTIEEYKAYAKQLENEVGTWHHAYDALMVERNQLVKKVLNLESELAKANAVIAETPKQNSATEIDTLTSGSRNLNEAIEAMAAELDELRKHEVAWDLDKAQIKVYEQRLAEAEEIDKARMKHINDCEKACKEMAAKIAALETELEQTQN